MHARNAMRCTPSMTNLTGGALVYRQDMFVDVPVMADLIAIRQSRQQLVDQNLIRHNRKHFDHHYRIGAL